jgi:SAM-dependent methyltransferase
MNTHRAFSTKAEKYARYRWSYAPAAVDTFCQAAELGAQSSVADLGAGTGILTRQLAGRVGKIYGVEPNVEMLREAQKYLVEVPNCTLLAACAESTGLPVGSVDAITVAEAAHWFDFKPALDEMLRILKPGGWLGLFHNYSTDEARDKAVSALRSEEYGASPVAFQLPGTPWELFFNGAPCQILTFPFQLRQPYDGFLGVLLSTSYMPDEDHPMFPAFEKAAREIFERFSQDGWMDVHGVTQLMLGVPRQGLRSDQESRIIL